jgi:UDP-N-acetyl-D-glucosamine dehydrogenase
MHTMQSMVSQVKELQDRLQQRRARVAVIGLGYAGLPLLCTIAAAGFSTVGIDRDAARVNNLATGTSPITDVPDELLQRLQDRLQFTVSYEVVRHCDISIICVPTPLKDQQPDLSAVIDAAQHLENVIPENHLVVLESTTYPGTTEEVIRPILETRERQVGVNLFLAYSPERVDPGNTAFGVKNTSKLVGGVTPSCTAMAQAFYEMVVSDVVVVSSPAVAEAAKLLENTYRFINIALVNEFAAMCHEMNLNVWEIIDAAATKPYGFTAFWPGLGVGGHCIPIDPSYLSWKARQQGAALHIVEVARDINERMPEFVLHRISDLLNREGRALLNSRVLVLGITYKPGVADARESPSLSLLRGLLRKGVQVCYHDPFIQQVQIGTRCLSCVGDLDEELKKADIVVVATSHPQYDWEKIEASARYIFDTRGALRHLKSPKVAAL